MIRCARPAASASGSRTSNTTPLSPSPVTSSYTGRRLTSGTAPAAWRAQDEARLRRGAVGRGDEDVGAREQGRLVAVRDELRRARAGRRAAACSTTARARCGRRRASRGRCRGGAARAGTGAAPARSSSSTNAIVTGAPGGRTARGDGVGAGRRRSGSRRGRSAAAARGSPRSSPGARRGGRRRAGRPCGRPGSRRRARSGRGSCRRSARASGAARRSRRSARTARARGRCRVPPWSNSSSIVRATSSGTAAPARARPGQRRQRLADGEHPRARRRRTASSPAWTARRPSRTRSCEPDGATISTRWPRAASSSPTRRTCSLTSCPDSHGYGVTWAMVYGPGTAGQHSDRLSAAPVREGLERRAGVGPSNSSTHARSSRSIACATRSPRRALSIALVRATAVRETASKPAVHAAMRSSSASGATISLTKRWRSAQSASRSAPVSSSSRAAVSPRTSGSSSVPALVATRPIPTSGVAKRARSVAMRRSQLAANSSAPPMQTPSIAARTGTGAASVTRVTRWKAAMVAAQLAASRRAPRTGRRRPRSARPRRARRCSGRPRRRPRPRARRRSPRSSRASTRCACLAVPADDAGAAERSVVTVMVGPPRSAIARGSSSPRAVRKTCGSCARPRAACRGRARRPRTRPQARAQRGRVASGSAPRRRLDVDAQRRHDRVAVGDDRVAAEAAEPSRTRADRLRVDVDRLHAQHVVAAAVDADARRRRARTRRARPDACARSPER